VNEIWPAIAPSGLVWGLSGSALPLAPGASLTLRPGDAYYVASFSSAPNPLPPGSAVYVQVDSADGRPDARFGGVIERDELEGRPYNNIAGPVINTVAVPLPSRSPAPALTDGDLPTRPHADAGARRVGLVARGLLPR
jgi:hypothetical protein